MTKFYTIPYRTSSWSSFQYMTGLDMRRQYLVLKSIPVRGCWYQSMYVRVFLEWYHDRNSRKSKCLETESILANLSDEIFGTSCLPRRTRQPPTEPPPRQPKISRARFHSKFHDGLPYKKRLVRITITRKNQNPSDNVNWMIAIKNFLIRDTACLIMATGF